MRRAASKCRPAHVSLNGYRTPDPARSRNEVGIEVDNNLRIRCARGYDRAARPSLDPRRCPRGWRHTESRRARERPAARRARAAPRPTRASIGLRGARAARRRSPRERADRRDRGVVHRRRSRRVHPRLRDRRAQDADRRAAGRRRRALATRQAVPARGRRRPRDSPGPSRRRRRSARRGSPSVHRRHAAATRRCRRAVPRGERVVLVADPKVAADVMIHRAGPFVKEAPRSSRSPLAEKACSSATASRGPGNAGSPTRRSERPRWTPTRRPWRAPGRSCCVASGVANGAGLLRRF